MVNLSRLKNPVRYVRHEDLEPFDNPNKYARECPLCYGALLLRRSTETFKLMPDDMCCGCGQHFHYLDVDKLNSD